MPSQVLAVIDIGSNSGRIVVLRVTEAGHLEVLADSRAPLRLARDVHRSGHISGPTIERTAAALGDFASVAHGASAASITAVATSAVRDAANAAEVLDRLERATGLSVRLISGDEEARYALKGAISGLPVDHGLLADIGGGSLELASFQDRRLVQSWTLPLGALRLSDEFLRSDPPTGPQIDMLRRQVAQLLRSSAVPRLSGALQLVGTGGTIRNLAKIDRRARTYPIPRLHGYVLQLDRVERATTRLASRTAGRRRSISGLNSDRADSIVGGAMVALTVMRHVGASEMVVSGQGLREGLALEAASIPDAPLADVRERSVRALAARFAEWDRRRADGRAAIAGQLRGSLWPQARPEVAERLTHAATLLDVGRSIDYYRRHQHAADIVAESDLAGFSHRDLALLAGVIRSAGDETARWRSWRPLLVRDDKEELSRSAAILGLADAAQQRTPPDAPLDLRVDRAASALSGTAAPPSTAVQHRRSTVTLHLPIRDPWLLESLSRRFASAFGIRLQIRPGDRGQL